MAASLAQAVIDGSPGNQLEIQGTGLVSGPDPTSVTLSNQGVTALPNLTPSTITLAATFNGTNVTVSIPDGVTDGTLTVTAGDGTVATCAFRACSQYVQAYEYIGEGEPVSSYPAPFALQQGELDTIIRRASAMCDEFMMSSIRKVQVLERHRYKDRQNGAPLIFPYRTAGRPVPILSVDQLTFVSAQDLYTTFATTDMYVNQDSNYIEILAYAVGNYALLGQLQIIGYSANVFELSYTSGFTFAEYPLEVRTATIITTTMLLNRRRRQAMGLGLFSEYTGTADSKLKIDPDAVRLPRDAALMLDKYRAQRLA